MKSIAIKEEVRRKRNLGSQDDGDGDDEKSRPSPKLEYTWTLMHGFYAGMGGFVIDLVPYHRDPSFVPRKYDRLTLTARGVKLPYECGHLPVMQKSDIKDKSKADGLAKTLVCLQAGWMCIQVLGRILCGFPVTLLEVDTLGHVFCAFVVYLLWWHKRQLMNELTKLEGDWVKPLCAFMFLLKHAWKEPGLAKLQYVDPRSESAGMDLGRSREFLEVTTGPALPRIAEYIDKEHNDDLPADISSASYRVNENEINGIPPRVFGATINRSFSKTTTVIPYQNCHGFVPISQNSTPSSNDEKEFSYYSPNDEQLERWRLAAEAYRIFPAVRDRFVESGENAENGSPLLMLKGEKPEELIHEVSGNWLSDNLLRETQGLITGGILWCASMVFSVLHIAAWADYFPSDRRGGCGAHPPYISRSPEVFGCS